MFTLYFLKIFKFDNEIVATFCFVLNPVNSFSCQTNKQPSEDGKELTANFFRGT